MKKLYLLLFIGLSISGCSTLHMTPEIRDNDNQQAPEISTYTISFDEKTKLWVRSGIKNKTKNILSRSIQVESTPISSQDDHSYHLDIEVDYWHGGAAGQDYLTGFSMGLIPSWGSNTELFTYRFTLYKGGKKLKLYSYSIDEKYYSHLILLPFALMDYLLPKKYLKYYTQALESSVYI